MGLALAAGCAAGGKAERDADAARSTTARSQPQLLYDAILAVYEQRELQVDIASEPMLLVSSRYQTLGPMLRRRYISRVVPHRGGVALNVNAEYQRGEALEDGEVRWKLVEEGDPLEAQAGREELELGRAVERQFHRMKKR